MDLKHNARQLRSNMTDAERHLWYYLRGHRFLGLKFKRQKPMGRYIVDFICLEYRLVIELDGGQHQEQVARDAERDRYFIKQGYRVLRFWNHEVLGETDSVLEVIRRAVVEPR
ncbi:endonuclease domain-containing protein [Pseudomonas sp. BN102]|uniref:endonuclease domain-containing protein n=1 Tax=Pseudomonas sp. BN102 TaxID=2567886 RepID=UPI0024548A06|nr:endonuclease domain-containing protein [Pseudomonas sp. BN102]